MRLERHLTQTSSRLLEVDGAFSNLVARLRLRVESSNGPSGPLREHNFPAGLQAQSNFVAELRNVVNDFLEAKPRRIAQILSTRPALDAQHADVREEDFKLMNLEEAEESLLKALTQSELTLQSLSNVVRSAGQLLPRERVQVVSFDPTRGLARLADGRLVLLPKPQNVAAPPLDQIQGVFHLNSPVDIVVSPMPDGSLLGHTAEAAEGISSQPTVAIDPRCLALRIVPADPALPDFDSGIRHHPRAYRWGFTEDAGIHFLEYGMAFAAMKLNCNAEAPGAYRHWLKILIDSDGDGQFGTLVHSLHADSPVFVLKPGDIPENRPVAIIVREFRAQVRTGGALGQAEVVAEETLIIEVNSHGFYAEADYDRTIFEIEDKPNETEFQSARVTELIRRFPLTMQNATAQTFAALSFKATGSASSYPNAVPIGLNETFAVHFQDPNEQLFFAHPDNVGKGLYGPSVKGVNNGKPFTYRVRLPKIVRDRLHACIGTDSYYRIPFIGPVSLNTFGAWHVSQGNNGEFTHKGGQKYAFDFPKSQGVDVLAARGGIVEKVRKTGCFSCWDPDAINEDGEEGDCVDCTGDYAGNVVKIRHQDGSLGTYVHFKKNGVKVVEGQRVYRGDIIGDVGTTGCSTGPHLHFHVTGDDPSQTIPIRFECFNDDFEFRGCFLPGHDTEGYSTNKPWYWPF